MHHEPAKTLASVWKASRTRWVHRIYTLCLAPRTSHQDGARKRPFSPGNLGTHKTLRFASLAAPIRSSITPHHSLFKTTITRAASRPPALVTVSARMMHDALLRLDGAQEVSNKLLRIRTACPPKPSYAITVHLRPPQYNPPLTRTWPWTSPSDRPTADLPVVRACTLAPLRDSYLGRPSSRQNAARSSSGLPGARRMCRNASEARHDARPNRLVPVHPSHMPRAESAFPRHRASPSPSLRQVPEVRRPARDRRRPVSRVLTSPCCTLDHSMSAGILQASHTQPI